MKNARAKRAKILFFIVKHANLSGFCCRRRRGCLSSLISLQHVLVKLRLHRLGEVELVYKGASKNHMAGTNPGAVTDATENVAIFGRFMRKSSIKTAD